MTQGLDFTDFYERQKRIVLERAELLGICVDVFRLPLFSGEIGISFKTHEDEVRYADQLYANLPYLCFVLAGFRPRGVV